MPNVWCQRTRSRLVVTVAIFLAATAPALSQGGNKAAPAAPVVPGFERFHAKAEGDSPLGGQLLLGELNCLSCHAPDAARETVILRRTAPVLDGVGSRVKAGFLRRFLSDPQAVKPGTVMPDAFADVPAKEKADNVEALVHFLASTGNLKPEKPQKKLIGSGRDLYDKVGCAVCHGTRDAAGEQAKLFPTSVPLGDLKGKYTLTSLRTFLENPHITRPSGRMPSLLNAKEAVEVANYLLQGVLFQFTTPPNMKYAYYEGTWDNLPDFDKLKPRATGTAAGFDLSLALRVPNMAMKFEGFLKTERDGDYRFHLTSDDGSKLFIDGKLVVANDGIHAPSTQTGGVKLTKGVHNFVAAVFNGGGGVELDVDIEGPGLGRQSASPHVFLTPEGNPGLKPPAGSKDDGPIAVQAPLVEKGRALFASTGCASCHTLNLGPKIVSTVKAPPLAKLTAEGGCLSPTPKAGVPRYPLSPIQRTALALAIKTPVTAGKLSAADTITRTMTAFNCYACHERNKVGGVLESVNALFTTAQPEMGDEGRLPPSLTGVGAKLTEAFLRNILDKGAHDRPYMFTRMPGFDNANVGALVAAFETADPEVPSAKIAFSLPMIKVKSEARNLVGAGALACIKCHTFNGQKAEGVQGIDMTLMTQRLRKSWFHVYMLDPNKYRPGTRMPAAWPNGETFYPKFLEGSTAKQIEGIWDYLADGTKAPLPPGMKKLAIPLVPTTEAIVYRNFIAGAGPRAIAVGYPEQAHLAFDANNLRLAMIWQGAFMDASRHWTNRGEGFEPPAGDNVIQFADKVAFAVLDKPDQAWPTKSGRDLPGYQFNGYRVTKDERPTFLYTIHGVKIEDFPTAVAIAGSPAIRRTLTLKANDPVDNLYFRAATGSKIVALEGGWYQINNEWKMRIESDTAPQIRQAAGQYELLVPIRIKDGQSKIVQEFQW